MKVAYQRILLAVDFFAVSARLINKAKELAELHKAQLHLIHVVDNLPMADIAYGDMAYTGQINLNLNITQELLASSRQNLMQLAEQLHIDECSVYLETGSPKTQIIKIANEQQIDLIVIGSHGRHGLALLLGSTANSVLHHANCDVLAVRLFDNE